MARLCLFLAMVQAAPSQADVQEGPGTTVNARSRDLAPVAAPHGFAAAAHAPTGHGESGDGWHAHGDGHCAGAGCGALASHRPCGGADAVDELLSFSRSLPRPPPRAERLLRPPRPLV
jgi:hypothetical protein